MEMEVDFMDTSGFSIGDKKTNNKNSESNKQGLSDTKVIGIQRSNGSWLLEDVINSLKWNQSLIESRNPCSDITLWVTTLALSYLEKYFADTKDLWAMVAKKAITFIKKGCKAAGFEYEVIIEKANLLVFFIQLNYKY